MPVDNRIPLFVRVPPSLKSDLALAAWQAKVSVSRYIEDAARERLLREREAEREDAA